jgi:hypothetical protein
MHALNILGAGFTADQDHMFAVFRARHGLVRAEGGEAGGRIVFVGTDSMSSFG